MKTQTISKMLLLVGFVTLAACSKKASTVDERGWSADTYAAVVANCAEQHTAVTPAEAKKYCECYITAVKTQFTFEQYVQDEANIDSRLEAAGTCQ